MKHNNLTPSEIQLVQRTFEMLMPLADTFALIFYDRFFSLEPAVRPLFRTDMALQRRNLIETVRFIVRGLDRSDLFVQELKEMGLRHASYRVEPQHYPIMKQAFLQAVDECLGERATEEMLAAWDKVLTFVNEVMLEGAAEPA